MKKILYIFVTIIILSSCSVGSNVLNVKNAPIHYMSDVEIKKDIQVTLFPIPLPSGNKAENIIIGNIKEGILNITLPKYLNDVYLFNPEDMGYTITKGLKTAVFFVSPNIYLINYDTQDIVEMNYFIYSNKKGKMTRDDEEIIFIKGWNVFTFAVDGIEIFNYADMLKNGYTWTFIDKPGSATVPGTKIR